MTPSRELLERVRERYEQGLSLQAFELAKESGAELKSWRGAEARVLAGRLAANLGGRRLANILHLLAWRGEKSHPEARASYARALLERRGPLHAWRWIQAQGDPFSWREADADWLGVGATALGRLRDFERAHLLADRARALAPDEPWLYVMHADLFEEEDRYDAAMATVEEGLARHPWHRPGVQMKAHLLTLMGKSDEALALLTEADSRLESTALSGQRALALHQREDWDALGEALDRTESLAPLADDQFALWLRGLRGEVAYHRGEIAQAQKLFAEAGPFYQQVAGKLEASEASSARRVQLPVGFVRQHHVTCAPATLTALSQFWGRPAEHLDVVEAICYDGTPGHSERHWAEEAGFVTREFTLTVASAHALLERGVPFTLATSGLDMGHLQAVIGYDSRRGTILIRDPYYPQIGEALAEELIASHQSTGPRAHVLVPAEKASLLEGVELPDAALWDRHHRLLRALERHRRTDAETELAALESEAPGHRLTFSARRALCAYDGDTPGLLAAIEGLLGLYPDDPSLQMSRLSCLRDLARRDERIAELKRLADDPKKPGWLLFARQYARELLDDARQHPEALERLKRILRAAPSDADALHAEGWIFWSRRKLPEALERFRLAACLEDKSEFCAHAYASTLRAQGRRQDAIAFLKSRHAALGTRSSLPARTLFGLLKDAGQISEALALLDDAMEKRPDDGDLLLFAALESAQVGRFAEAHALHEKARSLASEAMLLHYRAAIAFFEGDRAAEADAARRLVEIRPLSLDAHHALARALAASEGQDAVEAHFDTVVARFPHHLGLRIARIEWMRESGDVARMDAALKDLLEHHPGDAWGRRERALLLRRSGRVAEALAEAEEACRLQPRDTAGQAIRGLVLSDAGRDAEARQAYGLALQLDASQTSALSALLNGAATREEKRRLLAWFERELIRQAAPGEGIFAFRHLAQGPLQPDELLAAIERIHAARPDLWESASARVDVLTEQGRLDEALEAARAAAERFPLIPRLQLDLADTLSARGEVDEALEVLHALRERHPGYAPAIHRLRSLLERLDRPAEARAALEQALEADPLSADLHRALADSLYDEGKKEEALARLHLAIERDPLDADSWERLKFWSAALGRRDGGIALAAQLTARRPDDAALHLAAARALPGDALAERLRLVERAVALTPRSVRAYDLKAELLAQAGRYDEAKAACNPAAVFSKTPLPLRGRAAWVDALRGDLKGACKAMRAVVAEDASYYWGWSQLADWHYELGELTQVAECARWMTRLAPDDPRGWGYLGDVRFKQKDHAGATEALREALRRAPDYGFAATLLLHLQIKENDLAGAEKTLASLSPALAAEPDLLRMGLRVSVARKDRRNALARFEALADAALEEDEPATIARALRDLEDADWQSAALESLAARMSVPTTPTIAGMEWARGMLACGRADEATRHLTRLAGGTDAQRMAAAQIIAGHAEAGGIEKVRALLKQFAPMLRRPGKAWGTIAHAYGVLTDWSGAIAWTDNWRSHPDLEPWMLFNRVEALRCLGRDADAAETSRAALSLPPDYTTGWHALCLAFDAALAGEDPGPLLADFELEPDRLAPFPQQLFLLIRAIAVAPQSFAQARALFAEARAAWPAAKNYPGGRRWLTRSAEQLARRVGGPAAWLWARGASL